MKLIFEKSVAGRKAFPVPQSDVDKKGSVSSQYLRKEAVDLPEVAEVDLVRHYTNLSRRNFGVDLGFYPLGSCTMKYNPKINEDMASLPGFTGVHPHSDVEHAQGCLQLMYELQAYLNEITGMQATSLQPAAGAHGELTGIMIFRAYFEKKGEKRHKLIVPDASHGTNPATSTLCGFKEVVVVETDERGGVNIEQLEKEMDEDTAGLMLTNPNTLGLWDENIEKITEIVHAKGGLCYYDGANMNANLGVVRPGDMGFDVVHLNLHKSFSTPHGGGGPGSGTVSVTEELAQFLPRPVVAKKGDQYYLDFDRPDSIGRVKSFYGNFGVLIKAYTYIRALGPDGLKRTAENAVLNANYVLSGLKGTYHLPYDRICMHECVFSDKKQEEYGVKTLDIAKRLIDYEVHPPTVYFPLIVHGAIMIEPTETESKETLDHFIEVMKKIAAEAENNPELVTGAPRKAVVGRLDEVISAREPDLTYRPGESRPLHKEE